MGSESKVGCIDSAPRPAQDDTLLSPAIIILANLIKQSANKTYEEELGLSSVAWRIIARLGHGGPMIHAELAEIAQLDKGQLSRAVSRLADEGLVLRDQRTWRSIELRLAPKGLEVFAAIDRISRLRQEVFMAGVSKRQLREFRRTLATISANARELLIAQQSS